MGREPKFTFQWAEQTLRTLSEQGYTGTVTIRFAQGGVQSMLVNQELYPQQPGAVVPVRIPPDRSQIDT